VAVVRTVVPAVAVTVMVATPGATAVTTPVVLTVAIAADEVAKVYATFTYLRAILLAHCALSGRTME